MTSVCEGEKKKEECKKEEENVMDIDLYISACAAVSHPLLDQCHLCGNTEKSMLKACSGCKGVAYCSVLCQKSDWAAHKSACKLSSVVRNKKEVPVCKMTLPACGKTAIVEWMGKDKDTFPSYEEGAERIESVMLLKPEADKVDDAQRAAALADDPDAFDDDVGDSSEANKLQELQKMFAKANVTSQQIPIANIPELMDNIVKSDELVLPGGNIVLAFTYPLERPVYFSVKIDEPRLSRSDMLVLLHKLYALLFFDCTDSFACRLHSINDLFLHSLFHFGSSDDNSWAVVADT